VLLGKEGSAFCVWHPEPSHAKGIDKHGDDYCMASSM